MEINEGWSKGEKINPACVCESRSCFCPCAAHSTVPCSSRSIRDWYVAGVCERVAARDGCREAGREERKEGDRG